MTLDFSFLHAASILKPRLENGHSLQLVQVGAGGSGSWLAPHLCRIAKILQEQHSLNLSVKIIDPDHIEQPNLVRQNFCPAELGCNKAETLALRYGAALGLEVIAIAQPFNPAQFHSSSYRHNQTTILIGCVDNYLARRQLAECLKSNQTYGSASIWWLDLGNFHSGGQVLLGNTENLDRLKSAFPFQELCTALPSPALQHPELLEPEIFTSSALSEANLSCEELSLLTTQSLTINQSMAALASTYLVRLLSGRLKYFQTYLNLEALTTKSTYVTSHNVARVLNLSPGQETAFFVKPAYQTNNSP